MRRRWPALPEAGDIVGLPNKNFVGVVLKKVNATHWAVQTYGRRQGWQLTGAIDLDTLDMYDPPADTPDNVFADAMKVRLLT